MGIISEIEDKFKVKIESLNPEEKKTFNAIISSVEQSQLTLDKLKDYVVSMREDVERQIVAEPSFVRIFIFKVENEKLIKLQARLENYLLLETVLNNPQKARKNFESMLETL